MSSVQAGVKTNGSPLWRFANRSSHLTHKMTVHCPALKSWQSMMGLGNRSGNAIVKPRIAIPTFRPISANAPCRLNCLQMQKHTVDGLSGTKAKKKTFEKPFPRWEICPVMKLEIESQNSTNPIVKDENWYGLSWANHHWRWLYDPSRFFLK